MFSGSKDGRVHVWAADSGQKVVVLDGNHPGPTHCVKFNPKFMTMTTACTNVVSKIIEDCLFYHLGQFFKIRLGKP